MARKQVGMVDAGLLGRVDVAAGGLGQTRRVFVERALVEALARGSGEASVAGEAGGQSSRVGGQSSVSSRVSVSPGVARAEAFRGRS